MTHSQLIARLEQLTGPDREVDIEISSTLLGVSRTNRMINFPNEAPIWEYFDPERNSTGSDTVIIRKFTASVDAALALAAKVLPGCEYEITTLYNIARVTIHAGYVGPFYGTDDCCNVPIALCIAILKAHGASK